MLGYIDGGIVAADQRSASDFVLRNLARKREAKYDSTLLEVIIGLGTELLVHTAHNYLKGTAI